jgi:membrane-bound lytic murein transglycosylase|tara:strand:- start:193741 stop:194166 length:426 start_codon:yes stop_codon:yes gene_type:complete
MIVKNLPVFIVGMLFILGPFGSALASERPDHFHGKPADTLEAALTNFAEYNRELAAILKKEEVTSIDMAQIHELTYTLENALNKIRSDLNGLAETLEKVHVASERAETGVVRVQGSAYLNLADKIIRTPSASSQDIKGNGP